MGDNDVLSVVGAKDVHDSLTSLKALLTTESTASCTFPFHPFSPPTVLALVVFLINVASPEDITTAIICMTEDPTEKGKEQRNE